MGDVVSNFSNFTGSSSKINEVVFLNNEASTVVAGGGRVYLKGGVLETDLTVYPDANSDTFAYSGTNFSVAGEEYLPSGITWDGTYFWVLGGGTDSVYKYNASGVYQSVSFSVASQDTVPYDITWDGTHFWVAGSARVYKYNASGVYQGVSFTRESGKPPNMSGITFDGTSIWVVGAAHDKAYKYSVSGAYEGVSFDVSQDSRNSGITWDGTNLWVIGSTGDKAYKHIPAVGIESDTSFGGQNYVRVK